MWCCMGPSAGTYEATAAAVPGAGGRGEDHAHEGQTPPLVCGEGRKNEQIFMPFLQLLCDCSLNSSQGFLVIIDVGGKI